MEVRVLNHSAYRTQYYIVWITKYRHRVLKPANFKIKVEQLIREIAGRIVGVEVVELNAQPERVHMVAIIPPRYAVAKVVEIIKSRSAKVMRSEIEWFDKPYYDTSSFWSVGYFVSTIGLDEEMIKKYARYQKKQDSGQAKLEF
jgi:putative transposase